MLAADQMTPMEAAGRWLRRLSLGPARGPLRRLYHAAWAIRTLGRGLRRQLPSGETVFVEPAYRHINWNHIEVAAFQRAIRPGAVALDIGANVGAYSLALGHWVGSGGRVFAFEPSPSAFAGLRAHVALNHLADRVTPVRSAVAGDVGATRFIVEPTAGEGRLAAPGAPRATLLVPTTTVDAFCAARGITPDFMKVDVEGAELDVLRGARATIGRARDRLALFIELHPSLWRERGISRIDIEREARQLGLQIVSLVPGADPFAVEGVTAQFVPR